MEKFENPVAEKFQNVTVDKDTNICSTRYVKIGEYDARLEEWFWEGITASSLIFLKTEVQHLSNSELITLIRQDTDILDNFTFKDTGEYLFFNYGFIY